MKLKNIFVSVFLYIEGLDNSDTYTYMYVCMYVCIWLIKKDNV